MSQIASYAAYARVLQRAWKLAAVIELCFTPHSPRAGWATECRLRGMSIPELKARGRWAGDKSLAIYLDVSATMLLSQPTTHLRRLGSWALGDLASRYAWWR